MNPKLRALLVGGICATIAGALVILYTPDITTTRADLIDAGVTKDFTPKRLSCWVLFDGGYREFSPVVAVSKTLNADGSRDSIWPRSALPFKALIGDENTACRVSGSPTWAQVSDFYANPPESLGSCACNPGAGCFLLDGGPAPMKTTLQPGEFSGAGCVPKTCGELLRPPGGETSWPKACGSET